METLRYFDVLVQLLTKDELPKIGSWGSMARLDKLGAPNFIYPVEALSPEVARKQAIRELAPLGLRTKFYKVIGPTVWVW